MLEPYKRIVIKIGSALIADAQGLRDGWLHSIAADISALAKTGKQVIVVSSGAVALGRGILGLGAGKLTLEQKQAAAACGQIGLVSAWKYALLEHNLHVAQMLLTADDSEQRKRYLNARSTFDTLIGMGVIPIINENDTVATQELKVGDNDRLAARCAQMASADLLILLSDIDGLYNADPNKNPDAKHIPEVRKLTPEIESMAGGAHTEISSGGMKTKIQAAQIALSAGCDMIIARGNVEHPLQALASGAKHTRFIAETTPLSARKHWIVGSLKPMGALIVDAGAAQALTQGKSLLPAGVRAVEGVFSRGDAVWIKNMDGAVLGKGLAAYGAEDARKIAGKKSADIAPLLGYKSRDVLIHRDDMALNP